MKKLIFAAAAATILGSFAIGNTACSSKSENKTAEGDSTAVESHFAKKGDAFEPTTNIRYYEMDSVIANYELVKVFNEKARKTMLELQNAQQSRQSELQRLAQSIEQKARSNGYLTEASYNADMEDYQKKANQAQNYLAGLEARAQQEVMAQQLEVLDSVHSFLVDYNAEHHYDAIFVTQPGQLFNPALDITAEVVAGLNARYKKANPEEKK